MGASFEHLSLCFNSCRTVIYQTLEPEIQLTVALSRAHATYGILRKFPCLFARRRESVIEDFQLHLGICADAVLSLETEAMDAVGRAACQDIYSLFPLIGMPGFVSTGDTCKASVFPPRSARPNVSLQQPQVLELGTRVPL